MNLTVSECPASTKKDRLVFVFYLGNGKAVTGGISQAYMVDLNTGEVTQAHSYYLRKHLY